MTFAELLARRVRLDGARPLLICYDQDGHRTELSPITYANWIAKTANLITLSLDATSGDVIALPLVERHPGHWMTLVWVGACWLAGVEVVTAPDSRELASVSGPELDFGDTASPRYACSLHPLGAGFADPLPADVTDWSIEVRGEGDQFVGEPASGETPAWEGRALAEVLSAPPITDTVLLDLTQHSDPLPVITSALIGPLLGGGSSVTVHRDESGVAAREQARPLG